MTEEIDDLNSSLRDIRLENEEEIEFLRTKVVSKARNERWNLPQIIELKMHAKKFEIDLSTSLQFFGQVTSHVVDFSEFVNTGWI